MHLILKNKKHLSRLFTRMIHLEANDDTFRAIDATRKEHSKQCSPYPDLTLPRRQLHVQG